MNVNPAPPHMSCRADTSHLGLRRSLGIMCNYHYQLDSVYDNNRRYLLQHEVGR